MTFTLFVLHWAIEEDDSWVADGSSHLGMGDIFVDHDSVKNFAIFEGSSWDLFNSSISLNFKVKFLLGSTSNDSLGGFDGQIGNQFAPSTSKFGSNAALKCFENFFIFVSIDRFGDIADHLLCEIHSLVVGGDNLCGMDLHLQEGARSNHKLASHYDHRGGSIADFFILYSGEFDDTLGSRMLNIDFSQNGIAE